MRLEWSVTSTMLLVSTLVLVGAAPAAREPAARRDAGRTFALRLPPGWARTAGFSVSGGAPEQGEYLEVAHYQGPAGAWLRLVVDPPGEPEGYDAILPARLDGTGRIDAVRTVPPEVVGLTAVAVKASLGARRYLLLHGGGPDAPVDVEALRAVAGSLEPR
jgi:hypothetical protein